MEMGTLLLMKIVMQMAMYSLLDLFTTELVTEKLVYATRLLLGFLDAPVG